MFYLVASILSSLSILIFFKFFKQLKIDNHVAIMINYAVACAFGLMQYPGELSLGAILNEDWLVYALILGVFFLAGFLFFAFSTQAAGITITSVSANLSVVLPVGFAFMVYGDKPHWMKISGLALALIAILLIFKPSKGQIRGGNKLLFPIALFFIVGVNHTLMKHSEQNAAANNHMLFLSVIFGVSLILSLIYFIPAGKLKKANLNSIIGGVVLGMLNYYSTLFMLKALTKFESSLYFPVYNMSYISLAAVIGYIFFKEKLKKENWIGIGIAVLAIILTTLADHPRISG